MAYQKGFEKKSLETQILTLNALDRIEQLHQQSNQMVNGIFMDISTKISQTQIDIRNELQKHTSILLDISAKIDRYAGIKSTVDNSEVSKIIALSGNDKGKGFIGNLAFVIATLGVAFYALGKGLGQMTNINPQQAIAIGLTTFSIFAGLSLIFKEDVNISLVDAIKMAIIMPIIGASIAQMAEQIKLIPNISAGVIGLAVGLAAAFVPIAFFISEAYTQVDKAGLVGFFTGFALIGAIFLGELIIFPVLGRMLALTSAEFSKVVPLSPMQLVTAIAIAATLSPIIFFTSKMISTLFGGGLFGLITGILKMPFVIGATLGALTIIPLMAVAIRLSANILSGIPALNPMQLVVAILTAAALVPIAFAFSKLFEVLRGPTGINSLLGAIGTKISGGTFGGMIKNKLINTGLSVMLFPLLALATVASAQILTLMPTNISLKQLALVALVGLAIVPGAIAFATTMAILRFAGKSTVLGLFIAGLGFIVMAGAILVIANIFKLLPDEYKSPPLTWLLTVGFGMIAFSFSLATMAIAAKIAGPQGFVLGLLGFGVAALAAVGIAHLFVKLPEDFKSPPLMWLIKVGIGLGIVGGVIALLGALVSAVTPVGFGLGLLALLATAGSIIGVAWILNAGPKNMFGEGSIFYKVADTMEYFAYKIVDIFLYLLNGFIPIVKEVVNIFSMIADVFSKVVDTIIGTVERLGAAFISNLNGISSFLKDLASIGAVELGALGLSLISVAAGISAVMLATVGGSIGSLVNEGVQVLTNSVSAISSSLFGKSNTKGSVIDNILTLADNHKPIMFVAKALTLISSVLNSFKSDKDLNLIGLLYDGISSFFIKSKKGILTQENNLFTYLLDPIDDFKNSLTSLYKHQKSIDKFAKSIGTLANEMKGFKDVTNSFDIEKLNATNSIIQSLTSFANASQSNSIRALGKFAQDVTNQATNLYDKVFKVDDKDKNTTTNEPNTNLGAVIISLNIKLDQLQSTMAQILDSIEGSIDVNVINGKNGIID